MFPDCYFNCYDPFYRALPNIPNYKMPNQTQMNQSQMNQTTPQPSTMSPSDFETAPGSPTVLDTGYTQGYLRTQIGKRIRVTFLLGTNTVQDREGILVNVGISYIILKETETGNLTLCDIYSIKFVVIFQNLTPARDEE